MVNLVISAACAFVLSAIGATAQLPVHFNHGVASGDPLPDAVIIWTRVTPSPPEEQTANATSTTSETSATYSVDSFGGLDYNVTWRVSLWPDMSITAAEGEFYTSYERDWTVKVDVKGLEHSTQYYYQFEVDGSFSPTGRFRLPPPKGVSLEKLRYGVFTCSNWGWGYFNAYDYAAQLNLDFWMHMGDYLYEYGPSTYPSPEQAVRYDAFPGGLQPPYEMLSLADYRARYKTYRSDPGLQALHASAPLISIWDDHEHTNDPWKAGAQNHNEDGRKEGSWQARTERSTRVYHEYMPIRGGTFGESDYVGKKIWRSFDMGDLAKVVALEMRLTHRTRQFPENATDLPEGVLPATIEALGLTPPEDWDDKQRAALERIAKAVADIKDQPDRELLGAEQLAFLEKNAADEQLWTVVAQTTNVNDVASNYTGAIDLMNSVNPEVGAFWEEALYNLTHPGNAVASYSTSPYLLDKLGHPQELDDLEVSTNIASVALGQYGIISWFDPWHAYTAERTKFLNALKAAKGNAIVYAGDTHAAYGAMLANKGEDYVGAEYSCPGVTSPDHEDGSVTPLELHNAAQLAANNVWSDTRYKGFQLVTLTHEKHHTEFITVPWGSKDYVPNCQYAFDLYAADVEPGPTPPGPRGAPYAVPPDVLEEQLAQHTPGAERSAMKVVPCHPLQRAEPYSTNLPGRSITVSHPQLSENINFVTVY